MDSVGIEAPEELLEMMTGYWISQSISVVAQLGVADLVGDGYRSCEDLAAECGAHPESLYRVLRALACIEVFTEGEDRRFALTPKAQLLKSDHPHSMRALALMYGSEQYRAWGDLLRAVHTGEPAFDRMYGTSYFEYLASNGAADETFNAAMTGWSNQVADGVVEAYDFSESGNIIDIGGGHGLLLAAILRARAGMRGVVFELPHVAHGARELLQNSGVAQRCSVASGDFFDSVPQGGDYYILAQILHDWDDARSRVILSNCRSAMTNESKLLVVEQVIPPGNEPSLGKWLDLHMLVLLTGRERTEAEYSDLFRSGGFELTKVIPTQSGASVLEGVPA